MESARVRDCVEQGPLGHVLAGVLGGIGRPEGTDDSTLQMLVPVPSRPDVVRGRGHDPMLRIVRVAASQLRRQGHHVGVARLLRQRVPMGDQAALGHAERAANLHDSLAVAPAARRATARLGRAVVAVVCDDVLTTGATAREAQRALEDVGVRVAAVGCVAATRKRNGGPGPSSLPFSTQAD
jgi:predicted amidophosphoribosyltransferase